MALTLAVGFVVDDVVVVLENIVRHIEMGKTPMQAVLDGAKEIRFMIISMTISLTAVFIPLSFMTGIVGRLFHEFAVTISAANGGGGGRHRSAGQASGAAAGCRNSRASGDVSEQQHGKQQ